MHGADSFSIVVISIIAVHVDYCCVYIIVDILSSHLF